MTRAPSSRLARRTRNGIALISVIAVLVLLMIVATPFLLSMRDSARRGESFLYSVRVEAEAEALFDQVRGRLVQNVEYVERRKLDASGDGGAAQRPPEDATPTSDTLGEMALPPEMLLEFNKVSGAEHRVWGVEIVDAQSRFDLNSCSFPVLANLLGRAELTADIESGDDRIDVSNVAAFSPQGGAVRIGSEVIKYTGVEGTLLVGCKRGHMTEKGNGGADAHAAGSLVIDEAAYQIALRPFIARPGSRIRYTNVYEVRAIADQGVATIAPEKFDTIRRFVTAWSGSVVGDGWSNPQNVRANVTAGDAGQRYIDVKNIRYFGVGTVVMITDGVNRDYGVVVDVRGTNQIAFAGAVTHDYLADQSRIYGLSRTPLNVNTADEETLAYAFAGLKLRGRGQPIGGDTAARLASYLKQYKLDAEPLRGVYRTWQDFVKTIEAAREANVVDRDQAEAVLRNALNANDSTLSFSTVPLCFRSFDVYEARATAVLLDVTGGELARRELRRTFDVGSARSSLNILETQADFQEQTRLSRDSKWFASAPKNVNGYYDGVNIPPSEYQAYAERGRFPDTDRSPTVGHVQLAAGAYRYAGQNRVDRYVHFDEQDDPEGLDLTETTFSMGVDGPYSANDRLAEIVRFADVPQLGGNAEMGLAPFACSFWYKPGWDKSDRSERIIFDIGLAEHMNRVSLRHDPAGPALVLACADATREQRSAAIRYDYDNTTWMQDQWYHIACTVYGASPELMELFIDGQKQGNATLETRTTGNVSPTGPIQRLDVTSGSAVDFPQAGVLALHATEGFELMEYSSRDDNGFNISRRKARTIDGNLTQEPNRTHPSGSVVRLYGYAAPLLTDVRRGGSTVDNAFGPYRVFRMHATDDLRISGTDNQGAQANYQLLGLANLDSYQPAVTLTEWDTGSTESGILDDLGAQGSVGLAMIISRVYPIPPLTSVTTTIAGTGANFNGAVVPVIGGVNIVSYTVGQTSAAGLQVTINQQGISLPHYDSSQVNIATSASNPGRFMACYDYGIDPAATQHPAAASILNNLGSVPFNGSFTAFIPIALVGGGTGGDYLRPADEEQQLGQQSGASFIPGSAFVQVDGEWFRYDSIDTTNLSGRLAFVRDLNMDAIANVFGTAGLITESVVTPGQSAGQGGGAGTSSDTEPPPATDLNTTQFDPASPTAGQQPPIYGTSAVPEQTVPAGLLTVDIARAHDFRGWQNASTQVYQRVANTVPADHSAGANIIPCFALAAADWDYSDAARSAYPGFNDLITFRDRNSHDEQVRIQWGARINSPSAGLNYQVWAATTTPMQNVWRWDRPTDTVDLRRFPTQSWTRAIKFPSGEMPDNQLTGAIDKVRWGLRFDDGGGTTPGMIDELGFQPLEFPADADRPDVVELGEVPSQIYNPQPPVAGTTPPSVVFAGLDDSATTISVHRIFWIPASRSVSARGLGIPAEVFRPDGGLVRIGDELIFYADVDTANGQLTGCQRGVLGTTPQAHPYNALVFPVEAFPMSRLESAADVQAASFQLADTTDFPDDGYVRIGDQLEIVGYTQLDPTTLSGPLARIDPGADDTAASGNNRSGQTDEARRTGGALFRGRFGTTSTTYTNGDIVISMPFRYYDRYSERSDDPENSYVQFSWTKRGAIWKRVTWDQQPRKNVQVLALVRFQGGPEWDADNVTRLGQEPVPAAGRNKHIYEITSPEELNLLNVEADRVEVRMLVRYAQGAYDHTQDVAPDEWKQTPEIRKLTVEFVAPTSVLNQE